MAQKKLHYFSSKKSIWYSLSFLIFISLLCSYVGLHSCANELPHPDDDDKNETENNEDVTPSPPATKDFLVASDSELKTAISEVIPGDTITMKNKTWSDIDIVFRGTGTKEKPIILRAETGGEVIISGNSSLRLSGEYLVVDGLHFKDGGSSSGYLIQFRDANRVPANNSRITNIVVSGFNRADGEGSDVWVNLFGINNRVDHCFFHDKTSAGRIMTIWRPTDEEDHHTIDHNYFKDVPLLGQNGAEAIGVGASNTSMSDSYTTIEYNMFENCNGEGELLSIKAGRNTIRYNTVISSQSYINLRHGNNNIVEGNFVLGGRVRLTGGIGVKGEGHIIKNNYIQGLRGPRAAISLMEGIVDSPLHGYLQVKDVLIEGNTLIDNETNIIIGDLYNPEDDQTMPVMNSSLKDNVIIGMNSSVNLIDIRDTPINMTYTGNIVFIGQLSIADELGIRIEDPRLTLGTDGLYHYGEDNPLKNNVIGQPLQKSDVGPIWLKDSW